MASKIRIKSADALKAEFKQLIIDAGGESIIDEYERLGAFSRAYSYMEAIGGLEVDTEEYELHDGSLCWKFRFPKDPKYIYTCDMEDVETVLD